MKLKFSSRDVKILLAVLIASIIDIAVASIVQNLLGLTGVIPNALFSMIARVGILMMLLLIAYYYQSSKSFPNVVGGSASYNLNLRAANFQFPKIAHDYKTEVFLIGPNQNYFLNFKISSRNFTNLIRSLSFESPQRKIRILINHLASEVVEENFANLSFTENETMDVWDSLKEIDVILRKEFGDEKIKHIVQNHLLEVRATRVFLESFCFVDAGSGDGKAYFMLILRSTHGGGRPVFYLNENDDPQLFADYYHIYDSVYEDAEILWPNNKSSTVTE